MSEQLFDTLDLVYQSQDVLVIVNEFTELFKRLDKKIKQFSFTQDTFLGELKIKLKTDIAFLSPIKKNIALSTYGIIITEDIIKNFDPVHYTEDIASLLDATGKKTSCTKDEFLGVLTAYFFSLKKATKAITKIIRNFIELKGMGLKDQIIKSILNKRNFYLAFSEISTIFNVGEFVIDPRFVASIYCHMIEKHLYQENALESISSIGAIYRHIIGFYPSLEDEDIFYDLTNLTVIEMYYDKMEPTFRSKIETRKALLQEQFEKARKEFQLPVQSQMDKGRIEQISSAIEQTLFETLELGREINEVKKRYMKKNIETVLRRLAMEEFGVQDIGDPQKYLDYLLITWFSIFEQYPQLALPIIDIKLYAKFISEPREFIETNKEEIKQQLKFKIRRYTGGERFTPKSLAKAFSQIIYEFMINPTVQSLSF